MAADLSRLRGRLLKTVDGDTIRARPIRHPRGRPKGSKNKTLPALHEERLKTIIMAEAYRTITVNDVKGPVTIPMAQAVIRSLAVNAAKGNQRAQRLFAELVASVETANKHLHDQWLETAISYKVDGSANLSGEALLALSPPHRSLILMISSST